MKIIFNQLYFFRNIIALCLKLTLVPFFMREIVQNRKVTIIYYHDISPELFQKHIKYLRKRYSIISLDLFLDAINHNNSVILPKKSLIITFDDGWAGNHKLIPVIELYSLPITFFVCSEVIGTNRHFWFGETGKITIDLKKVQNNERLTLLSKFGFHNDKVYENTVALTDEQINELIAAGCNIQSHTLTHPILPMCDESTARNEIIKSKQNLEKRFKTKINYISLPNGDYSEREIQLCKEAGYKACLTSDLGYNDVKSNPYRLKRICMSDKAGTIQLSVMVAGIWSFLASLIGLGSSNKYYKE
jgi:poly-beta-1,6-N-acetyl-D-glucosamine N-deacetylase